MSYFFEKIKIIFKKIFSDHFITKKKSDLKMDIFFEKKFTNLILNVFLHLCNLLYTMSYFF